MSFRNVTNNLLRTMRRKHPILYLLRAKLSNEHFIRRVLRISVVIGLLLYLGFIAVESDTYIKLMKDPVVNITGADRGRCCRGTNKHQDVCGRSNCISFCATSDFQLRSPPNRDQAFLHETSGASALDSRQACAVESLASVNPNLTIHLLLTGKHVDWKAKTMQALQKHTNIQIRQINLGDYFLGTPLEQWYFCTTWNYGQHSISHLSDALRFLTLYKFGGYYFDLDIIMLKPVASFRNFIVAEDEEGLAAGAIHVEYNHPVIKMAIEEFRTTYNKNIWGYNGPLLITRVLQKWCTVKKVTEMVSDNCRGFQVFPPTLFYPIKWQNWEKYFMEEDISWGNDTLGIHVWNKKSASVVVYKNSSQVYTRLARSNCPLVFSIVPEVF